MLGRVAARPGAAIAARRSRIGAALNRSSKLQVMGLFNMFGSSSKTQGCELAPKEAPAGCQLATFAGGCFWGLELAYQRVPGVVSTFPGYTGGKTKNPTYDEVCSGMTGHTEIVQVVYRPDEVGYDELLDVFFDKVDPTTPNRQGGDRGTQYRSGIFVHTPEQRAKAEAKVAEVNAVLASGRQYRKGRPYELGKVVSEITDAGDVYVAEEYHRQYLAKGGRFNRPQSAAKGCTDTIRCYG